jgi:hypothetical protein
VVLLFLACTAVPIACRRNIEDEGFLGTSQSKDECHSAAMQLMMRNREAFSGILQRNNVAVDDDGVITLPTLKNIVPYEGISNPPALLGKGGSGVASYHPKIKNSVDGVSATLNDLKSLLDILGVKELNVKGICGGKNYAPGGNHYNAEWTDGWMKVAEKRASALLVRLGMSEKSGVTVEGDFGEKIGVEITVTSLMKISVMKNLESIHEDCDSSGVAVSPPKQRELTPAAIFEAAKEVLDRGHIDFTQDENIALQDKSFKDNVIPFKKCVGKPGTPKHERLLECVEEVAIEAPHIGKAKEAMKDIADLALITGVTDFGVTGYTRAKPNTDEEKLAAQKLGAARARLLVQLLAEFSVGTPLAKFSDRLRDDMTECITSESGDKCDNVSKFGQIAVAIHMETLTNPSALGR